MEATTVVGDRKERTKAQSTSGKAARLPEPANEPDPANELKPQF